MKICTIAFDTVWKDPKANIIKTEQCVKEALQLFPDTQVILFPELSFMGSVVDDDIHTLAQTVNGECVTQTRQIAKKYGVHIIAGFIEKAETGNPYNTTFFADNAGGLKAVYRKNHLYAGSRERELYQPEMNS